MDCKDTKNIIILKNLPSNLIEEAIILVKEKKSVKDLKISDIERDISIKSIREEDFRKLEKIPKDTRSYVIKEAETVLSNYLEDAKVEQLIKTKLEIEKKCSRLKYLNIVLLIASVLSTTICVLH